MIRSFSTAWVRDSSVAEWLAGLDRFNEIIVRISVIENLRLCKLYFRIKLWLKYCGDLLIRSGSQRSQLLKMKEDMEAALHHPCTPAAVH